MQMFKDRPTWTEINTGGNGGLCANFRATMSFEQHNRYKKKSKCTKKNIRRAEIHTYNMHVYMYLVNMYSIYMYILCIYYMYIAYICIYYMYIVYMCILYILHICTYYMHILYEVSLASVPLCPSSSTTGKDILEARHIYVYIYMYMNQDTYVCIQMYAQHNQVKKKISRAEIDRYI